MSILHPYYSQLSVTNGARGRKFLAVQTSANVTVVEFDKATYKDHQKIFISERIDRENVSTFKFTRDEFSASKPPILIIGYESGLVIAYTESKLMNALNFDLDEQETIYKQPVRQIITTPNEDEIIVGFKDSSLFKYNIKYEDRNPLFLQKCMKATTKTVFTNREKYRYKKSRNGITKGAYLSDTNPEHSNLYLLSTLRSNPNGYYKFNCRTITHAAVVEHQRFRSSFLKYSQAKSNAIMALVNSEGYFVVFDYERMEPQFSCKSFYGGYSSFSFSAGYEFLALAGHDDCITVLSVENLAVVKCVGHRSFVSRALFQNIALSQKASLEEAKQEGEREIGFVRLIGGSMDGRLSFFELDKKIFQGVNNIPAVKSGPMSLSLRKLPEPLEIKPLAMHELSDAVGWFEICGELLVACTMDGTAHVLQIRDGAPAKDEQNTEAKEKNNAEMKQNKHVDAKSMDPVSQSITKD